LKRLLQARTLLAQEQYADCIKTCNQLVRSVPEYGLCYSTRAYAYERFSLTCEPGSEQFRQYTAWARDDYLRASALDPDLARFGAQAINCGIALGVLQRDDAALHALILEATSEIEREWQPTMDLAQYLSSRATCRSKVNDLAGAKADVDEAIRLVPNFALYWFQRASILESLKQPAAASESYRIGRELIDLDSGD
jgi:Tfp pilus assembly protein PilF